MFAMAYTGRIKLIQFCCVLEALHFVKEISQAAFIGAELNENVRSISSEIFLFGVFFIFFFVKFLDDIIASNCIFLVFFFKRYRTEMSLFFHYFSSLFLVEKLSDWMYHIILYIVYVKLMRHSMKCEYKWRL